MKNTLLAIAILLAIQTQAQTKHKDSLPYQFTSVVDLQATSVKNQHSSGTCWAFSSLSFVESELIRMGKGEHDLAEMWLVQADYHARAVDFVRWQGAKNFGPGAESNNAFDRIADVGIVPEEIYTGLEYGQDKHVHGEMDALLESYVNTVIKDENRTLSTAWLRGYDGILDAYLGEKPESFSYEGANFSPETFRDKMGIVPTNYIEISSFTHHPFYNEFVIEVPDNWSLGTIYNIPLDELLQTAYYALDAGYTLLWGSDVSEKGFSHKNGLAIIPEDNIAELQGSEQTKWESMTEKERKAQLYAFDTVVQEKVITQEMRQQAFDNYQTEDDHGIHITGYATNQKGDKFFKVKNSWGTENPYEGYFYASEPWFLYKTLSIMLHKDAVPKDIKKKLNIK